MDGLRARRRVAVAAHATAAASPRDGAGESIHLDEVLYVPLLAMLEPASLIVITAVTVGGAIAGRRNWVKTVFNVGQMIVSCSAGILVVYALGVTAPPRRSATRPRPCWGPSSPYDDALRGQRCGHHVAGDRCAPSDAAVGHRSPVRPWVGAITLGGIGTIATERKSGGRGPDGSRGHVRSPHERRDVPRADGPAALRASSAAVVGLRSRPIPSVSVRTCSRPPGSSSAPVARRSCRRTSRRIREQSELRSVRASDSSSPAARHGHWAAMDRERR